MATNYWDLRFFQSTRGQIVTMLRRSKSTVEDLARALDLSDNGVRAHLAILERDGIVLQRGSLRRTRSGGGKPAYVYELTQEGEDLFAKAYEPTLGRLLDVLCERLGLEESEALLRLVGHRMVEGKTVPTDGARARLEAAAGVLNELGDLAELEERDCALVIRATAARWAA